MCNNNNMQQANIFNSKARIIKRSRLKNLVPENLLQQEIAQRLFSYLEDELQNHSTKQAAQMQEYKNTINARG